MIYNNYVIHLKDRETQKERGGLNNSGHPALFVCSWVRKQDWSATHIHLHPEATPPHPQPSSSASPASASSQAPFLYPSPKAFWCSTTLSTMSPFTFSFSAQCSMTTRWDGQQRLGWTAASWVGNSRHWGPSVYMFTDVYGSHLSGC